MDSNPEYYNELGEKALKEGDLRSAYKNFSWAVMLGCPDGPALYDPTNKKNKINCNHLFNKAMVLNKFTFNFDSGVLSSALETIEIVLKNEPLFPGAKKLKEELLKEHSRTEIFSDGTTIYKFINAKLNGISITKNKEGITTSEKMYVNDILEGSTKLYHTNGQLECEIQFIDGQQADEVVKTFDESGNLIRMSTIQNCELNGLQTLFHANGKIKSETMMKDGEKLGIFKEYDTEGKLIKEGENKKEKLIQDYNLQELINLLNNNSELKIEAMIYEEQRGAFQVIDEKEYEEFHANLSWNTSNRPPRAIIDSSNEIYDDVYDDDGEIITIDYNEVGDEIIELNTEHYNYEYHKKNIDLTKKVYGQDFCEWIEFEIDKEWLIEEINEYYEGDELLENTIEDLRDEYWSDYTPPEAIVEETLCGSEIDSGTGTHEGRDDISWSCTSEYRHSYIELKLV